MLLFILKALTFNRFTYSACLNGAWQPQRFARINTGAHASWDAREPCGRAAAWRGLGQMAQSVAVHNKPSLGAWQTDHNDGPLLSVVLGAMRR